MSNIFNFKTSKISILSCLMIIATITSAFAQQTVRIKDLVEIKGTDDNYLKGVGLVVGLNKTGDSPKSVAKNMEANMLLSWEGYQTSPEAINSKNIAVVAVTAKIPAFQEPGTKINIEVASLGDAKSLKGGKLLITPLRGPGRMDSKHPESMYVYATAQGNISVGEDKKGHLTTGSIPNGAIIVRSINHNQYYEMTFNKGIVTLYLKEPDFNVANAITDRINSEEIFKVNSKNTIIALPESAGKIKVAIPKVYMENLQQVKFISQLMELEVLLAGGAMPEAKIIINESKKTWIITGKIEVGEAMVQAGSIRLKTPFIVKDENKDNSNNTPPKKIVYLSEILEQLKLTETKPEDIIEIIKQLKVAGAIKADIQIIN